MCVLSQTFPPALNSDGTKAGSIRVAKDENDRVPSEKKLTDVPLLILLVKKGGRGKSSGGNDVSKRKMLPRGREGGRKKGRTVVARTWIRVG
jgi:hypothetical protein